MKRRYVGQIVCMTGLLLVITVITGGGFGGKKEGYLKRAFAINITDTMEEKIGYIFCPVFSFSENSGTDYGNRVICRQVKVMVPYLFAGDKMKAEIEGESNKKTVEMVLMEEAMEENEESDFLENLFLAENQAAREKMEEIHSQEANGQKEYVEQNPADDLQNDFVLSDVKKVHIDMKELEDYETFIETFYTIDKSTAAGKDLLDVSKLNDTDMTISKDAQGPHILIYHTHSQEAFADSDLTDPDTTIVGVGARLGEILTEVYGYQVLHHKGTYDVPSRDDAYSQALPEIEKILKDNPQIQVVIDLHRDAMDEGTRLVTEINGRPTARFMFFNGLSRTRKTGNISYLYNENLESNLAFSFQMQKAALEYYPGLTRKVYLKAYRYNMHLRPKNLLVELGAQNNTLEEALNACEPLAHILNIVLSGQK